MKVGRIVIITIVVILIVIIVMKIFMKSEETDVLAPKNVKVIAGDSSVDITWDEVPETDHYTIYHINEDKEFTYGPIKNTKVRINSISKGEHKFFVTSSQKVRSKAFRKRVLIESPKSEEREANVINCSLPLPPSNVDVSIEGDDVKLEWSNVHGVDGYVIHVNPYEVPKENDEDHQKIVIVGGDVNSHILNGLIDKDRNIKWYFSISSYHNHCGSGEKSGNIEISI